MWLLDFIRDFRSLTDSAGARSTNPSSVSASATPRAHEAATSLGSGVISPGNDDWLAAQNKRCDFMFREGLDGPLVTGDGLLFD